MAKLTIEIEENEFALYDYRVSLNGDEVDAGENYTAEEYALDDAYQRLNVWMAHRD